MDNGGDEAEGFTSANDDYHHPPPSPGADGKLKLNGKKKIEDGRYNEGVKGRGNFRIGKKLVKQRTHCIPRRWRNQESALGDRFHSIDRVRVIRRPSTEREGIESRRTL